MKNKLREKSIKAARVALRWTFKAGLLFFVAAWWTVGLAFMASTFFLVVCAQLLSWAIDAIKEGIEAVAA